MELALALFVAGPLGERFRLRRKGLPPCAARITPMSSSARGGLVRMCARMLLIHGAADTGWAFHRLATELESRGHAVAAPDLPCEHEEAGLEAYADAALAPLAAMGRADEPVVVLGHSLGGYTAPTVAERARADHLVVLTAMVPRPGERASEWWGATGLTQALGTSEYDATDEVATFMHFPAAWMRGVAEDRLGTEPIEVPGSHCAPLSRPAELAAALDGLVARTTDPA